MSGPMKGFDLEALHLAIPSDGRGPSFAAGVAWCDT